MLTSIRPIGVFLCAAIALAACRDDETLTGYGAASHVWTLVELDGSPFAARATLSFPEPGKITGQAPCNRFFSSQSAPYPWFRTGPVAASKMACAELAAEQAFLTALSEMTLAEVNERFLLLSDDQGREMLFIATPDDQAGQ